MTQAGSQDTGTKIRPKSLCRFPFKYDITRSSATSALSLPLPVLDLVSLTKSTLNEMLVSLPILHIQSFLFNLVDRQVEKSHELGFDMVKDYPFSTGPEANRGGDFHLGRGAGKHNCDQSKLERT